MAFGIIFFKKKSIVFNLYFCQKDCTMNLTLKRKRRHLDKIIVTGCTESVSTNVLLLAYMIPFM